MLHGNTGFRVKNLWGTSRCAHRNYPPAPWTKCAVNGCKKDGIHACHVISANQNDRTGQRFIVYMCASHNKLTKFLPFVVMLEDIC